MRKLRARFLFQREMKLRLLSAAVLIPLVIGALWLGEIAFAGIVLLTALLVQDEWLRMVGGHDRRAVLWGAYLVQCALTIVAVTLSLPAAVGALAAGAVLVAAVAAMGRHPVSPRWVGAGVLYAGAAIIAMIELRKGADGFGAVVFVLLIAWTTDTAAFFVGRKMGGPKLWRRVSPSKTWSGAIGGLVCGALCGAFVLSLLDAPWSLAGLFAAALVAVASIGGDLLESAAKRRFAIKDAGSLIPGHGGVMDRVDGLIAASLVTMLIGAVASADTAAGGFLSMMGRL
ncbi:phosphatidate cytidylyltransferase [Acuticoccus yangtzensis]|uniref:phosphatidate cytidylyltransferase n=1 Tax=Acuticoccus yangtzensis TaxID=1443441 RepID=UPI000B304DD8|nr:phosphatidate cytidylyltransferase [Acuticoccus yangtzensis]